jgi:hypothetical protein
MKPGKRVEFEVFGVMRKSDIDEFGPVNGKMTAVNTKVVGKTLDNFIDEGPYGFYGKSDEWLRSYMKKIKDGSGPTVPVNHDGYLPPCEVLVFKTGKPGPSPETISRIEKLAEEVDFKVDFAEETLLPPPYR